MYTFEWTPKDQEKSQFTGTVTVKVPSHVERMSFLKTVGTSVDENGQLIADKKIDLSIKLIGYASKYIEKVDLARKEDSFKVPDKTWLEYDVDGAEVLGAIGWVLFDGVKLGKS